MDVWPEENATAVFGDSEENGTVVDPLKEVFVMGDVAVIGTDAAGMVTVLSYVVYLTWLSLWRHEDPFADVIAPLIISGNLVLLLSGAFAVALGDVKDMGFSALGRSVAQLVQTLGHVTAFSEAAIYTFVEDAGRKASCIITFNILIYTTVAAPITVTALLADQDTLLPLLEVITGKLNLFQKGMAFNLIGLLILSVIACLCSKITKPRVGFLLLLPLLALFQTLYSHGDSTSTPLRPYKFWFNQCFLLLVIIFAGLSVKVLCLRFPPRRYCHRPATIMESIRERGFLLSDEENFRRLPGHVTQMQNFHTERRRLVQRSPRNTTGAGNRRGTKRGTR